MKIGQRMRRAAGYKKIHRQNGIQALCYFRTSQKRTTCYGAASHGNDDFWIRDSCDTKAPLNKISGMPVVDHEGGLVGIITLSDLCRVIFSLTGFGKKGIQFAIQLTDKPHTHKEITDIIRSYGSRVSSVRTY